MASITYIAKREIKRTTFSATGTDISANGTDDSFNSITTALNGVADNEWIYVSGFSNAANNGWFQANGASTSTKITQDTSTSLVTEAAGPAVSILGYVRGYGQSYSLDFDCAAIDPSGKVIKNVSRALDGNAETIRHRHDREWSITTDYIHQDNIAQWREIWHSVDGGETFTLDPYGTAAVPDNVISVELVDDSYQERRINTSQYFQISFRVREL